MGLLLFAAGPACDGTPGRDLGEWIQAPPEVRASADCWWRTSPRTLIIDNSSHLRVRDETHVELDPSAPGFSPYPGDILLSSHPELGVLRRVVRVETSEADGWWLLHTAPAGLTEAFEELHIGAGCPRSNGHADPAAVDLDLQRAYELDHLAPDGELATRGELGLFTSGHLALEVDIHDAQLQRFQLEFQVRASAMLDLDLRMARAFEARELPLRRVTELRPALAVGPVVVTPAIELDVTLTAASGGPGSVGLTQEIFTFAGTSGVLFDEAGWRSIGTMSGRTLEALRFEDTVEANLNAKASASLLARVETSALIFESPGPSLVLRPLTHLEVDAQPAEPGALSCPSLTAELSGRVEAAVQGPGQDPTRMFGRGLRLEVMDVKRKGRPVVLESDGACCGCGV